MSTDARLAELRLIGPEEGIVPNAASEADLKQFALAFGAPSAIFLLDSGNLRARWHSPSLSSAIEFEGDGNMRVLHLKRAGKDS